MVGSFLQRDVWFKVSRRQHNRKVGKALFNKSEQAYAVERSGHPDVTENEIYV